MFVSGQRVWVMYEDSMGTIVSVDTVCESCLVTLDSDGETVDAGWAQLFDYPVK